MKKFFTREIISWKSFSIPTLFATLAIVGCMSLIGSSYYTLGKALTHTQLELASSTRAYITLSINFGAAENENTNLHNALDAQLAQNDFYAQQINSISSTVGQLYKLSQTDKELLQKYSAVYFLNENYVPSSLSLIDQNYLFHKDRPEQIHTNVNPYLESLLNAASGTGLLVLSAYRSFGTQANLKTSYKITYGAGTANQFSADQGYSEHQLGSTVDFTTSVIGDPLIGFEKTSAYQWLVDNAYKYGFVISYPKGNTFFIFEPWHWRFVGVELATTLHNQNEYFYNMDQRQIDTYLAKIFD